MRTIGLMYEQLDVRSLLSAVTVPTLVLYRSGDGLVAPALSRTVANGIPGAREVELAGADHLFIAGDQNAMIDEIEEFVTGRPAAADPDRMLATVLFTDIVGSTQRAAELGDRRWRELLGQHEQLVARELGALPRPAREVNWRWRAGNVRRSCPRGALGARDPRGRTCDRVRAARGCPHRRMRGDSERRRWHRRPSNGPCAGGRATGRGVDLRDGQGSSRRFRPPIRATRSTHAEGCPWRMAALRGHGRCRAPVAASWSARRRRCRLSSKGLEVSLEQAARVPVGAVAHARQSEEVAASDRARCSRPSARRSAWSGSR